MKKKTSLLTAIVLLLAGVICGGIGIYSWQQEKQAGKEYEKLKEEVVAESEPIIQTTPTEAPVVEEETKEPIQIPIDFQTLKEKNPDVYAWIRIPGTDIDYPILQRVGDNSYYLDHTLEGKEKPEGAIFTEDYNSQDFSDANTVIYGHNMKNGSMFRQLHEYQDRKFMKEHPEVVIYQPDKILHYQIFAAYVYDNRHLLQSFDFEDREVYKNYLQSIQEKKDMGSSIDSSIELTGEDPIITLSTCNGNDEQRYLVQAVLLSIEQ